MTDEKPDDFNANSGLAHERPEAATGTVGTKPAFNVPGIILFSLAVLVAVHLYRIYALDERENFAFVLAFAFFPARFDALIIEQFGDIFPGGFGGALATFVTYGFLHADWLHLIVNGFWMLVFGSALARRFGGMRFLLISLIGSICGALMHLATNWGSEAPMVGASAAISAHMACAARFAFVPYGPLGRPRTNHPGAYFLPALSVRGMMKNAQVLSFLGVWFAINLLFGLGSGIGAGVTSIAWQAHIGGFLAGLLLFSVFDPVEKTR